jgi:hypothetical protein
MRATIRAALRNAGWVVTSSTLSPYAQISRPSRMDSRYSAPVSGVTVPAEASTAIALSSQTNG